MRILRHFFPQPRIEGLSLVPPRDPFLLVSNHFQSPHLWVGWVAAAITAAVATARDPGSRDLHWVVLSQWRWFEVGSVWVPNPISSLLFPRAAHIWGLVSIPSRPSDVAGRARALRRAFAYLGRDRAAGIASPEPVGLFPEGKATTALEEARPGTGAFIHRVSRMGVPILPVGTHLDGDTLVLRFGEPFFLTAPPAVGVEDWAREQTMVAIGRLLPREMWGVYAPAIASAG